MSVLYFGLYKSVILLPEVHMIKSVIQTYRFFTSFTIDILFIALDEAMSRANNEEIYIPYGVGICGHVAKTKETINLKDAYEVLRITLIFMILLCNK